MSIDISSNHYKLREYLDYYLINHCYQNRKNIFISRLKIYPVLFLERLNILLALKKKKKIKVTFFS